METFLNDTEVKMIGTIGEYYVKQLDENKMILAKQLEENNMDNNRILCNKFEWK